MVEIMIATSGKIALKTSTIIIFWLRHPLIIRNKDTNNNIFFQVYGYEVASANASEECRLISYSEDHLKLFARKKQNVRLHLEN